MGLWIGHRIDEMGRAGAQIERRNDRLCNVRHCRAQS